MSVAITHTPRYSKRCPLCQGQKDILRRAVPLLRNMLAQLQLHCLNRANGKRSPCSPPHAGCQELVQYDRYGKHIEECQYQMDACKNTHNGAQCGQRMLRLQLRDHQRLHCPFRAVQCRYCGMNLVQRDAQQHEETCPLQPVLCPKCKEEHRRCDEKVHLLDCAQNYVVCQHCHQSMLYRAVLQHEPDCEMRLVSCMGCHQSMELRHYYQHQGECDEFPVAITNTTPIDDVSQLQGEAAAAPVPDTHRAELPGQRTGPVPGGAHQATG